MMYSICGNAGKLSSSGVSVVPGLPKIWRTPCDTNDSISTRRPRIFLPLDWF
jgi:hypothetical protein